MDGVARHEVRSTANRRLHAQSRKAALAKFRDEHIPVLDGSTFGKRHSFELRKSTGSEAVVWKNGSLYSIDAATETAGHGPTLDLGLIDEAWAHEDDSVEQAMAPATITRPSAQLLVASTAGNARSRYWYRKVLAGRVTLDGAVDSTAYFEWSADDDDPEDPATWWAWMPALGFTVTEATIAAELARAKRSGKLDLFKRAYLNQWTEVRCWKTRSIRSSRSPGGTPASTPARGSPGTVCSRST